MESPFDRSGLPVQEVAPGRVCRQVCEPPAGFEEYHLARREVAHLVADDVPGRFEFRCPVDRYQPSDIGWELVPKLIGIGEVGAGDSVDHSHGADYSRIAKELIRWRQLEVEDFPGWGFRLVSPSRPRRGNGRFGPSVEVFDKLSYGIFDDYGLFGDSGHSDQVDVVPGEIGTS